MMGPNRTYHNDIGGTQYSCYQYESATFHPTYNNTAMAELEDEAKRLAEIDRLEAMMHDRGCHEVSMHVKQAREVHHARLAPMKHKKPHMNRKVIR